MTWKQFVRRFKEMMADTSTTPLGVTDLEAWHKKQKQITERLLREEQEKREQAKNWLNQGIYTKASLLKKIWMCLQYIYWDTRGEKQKKLKFTFKEQKEFETIDDDIAALEERIEELEQEMLKNATNSAKLSEIMAQKEEAESALEEKMERWVYLNDLAERIEAQNS